MSTEGGGFGSFQVFSRSCEIPEEIRRGDPPTVVATMIFGKKREPFLFPALESLHSAVDALVVNINGHCEENRKDLENSSLYRSGRVKILRDEFRGFGPARNLCLDWIRERGWRDLWILLADADDVHGRGLRIITREFIPLLPEKVGVLDTYFLQFMQSFRHLVSIDRKHNFLLRWNTDLRWEGQVHERLLGLKGERWITPYLYFHYGYVLPPDEVLAKWKQYERLGDKSYSPEALERIEPVSFMDEEAQRCFEYKGDHPETMRDEIERMERALPAFMIHFRELCLRPRKARIRLAMALHMRNLTLRIAWRRLAGWFYFGKTARGRKAYAELLREVDSLLQGSM